MQEISLSGTLVTPTIVSSVADVLCHRLAELSGSVDQMMFYVVLMSYLFNHIDVVYILNILLIV